MNESARKEKNTNISSHCIKSHVNLRGISKNNTTFMNKQCFKFGQCFINMGID
jgi:hypothetical protein